MGTVLDDIPLAPYILLFHCILTQLVNVTFILSEVVFYVCKMA